MLLRSVYTKTLRDLRWGVLGWGAGLGVLVAVTAVGWANAYPTVAARAVLESQIRGGLSAAQVIYGPPRAIGQLGGFVEWRVLGLAPVLLGLYVILAGTGMTRGAEESRTIEVVVASPTTRARVLLEQGAGLLTGLALAAALVAGFTVASGVLSGEATPSVLRASGSALNIVAAALLFGSLGLLSAQLFERRRTAALAAIGLMALLHLMNTLPLVVPAIRGVRYASPMYLYTRSSPLANGHMDWLSVAGLLMAGAAVAGVALLASQRRDLFDTYRLGRARGCADEEDSATTLLGPVRRQAFLRNSLGRALRDAVGTTLGWAVGLSTLAVLMTALAPNMRQALQERSDSFFRNIAASEKDILSALLFAFLLPPLVALIGVQLAASWAGDEVNERLELELAAPVPRWKVFVQRLLAAIICQGVALAIVLVAVVATIEAGGVDVPIGRVAEASLLMLVLAGCVTAFGFAVASWRPSLTAALAGAFVAVSYFGELVLPLLNLPDWTRNLTVFGLYGAPLANGVRYWSAGVLLAGAIALAAVGAAAFQRKDVAR